MVKFGPSSLETVYLNPVFFGWYVTEVRHTGRITGVTKSVAIGLLTDDAKV